MRFDNRAREDIRFMAMGNSKKLKGIEGRQKDDEMFDMEFTNTSEVRDINEQYRAQLFVFRFLQHELSQQLLNESGPEEMARRERERAARELELQRQDELEGEEDCEADIESHLQNGHSNGKPGKKKRRK